MSTHRSGADLLFDADGNVRLPKAAAIGISQAIAEPRRCLTRQPTRERAEKVADALAEMVAARGYDLEVRLCDEDDTYGVYLKTPEVLTSERVRDALAVS